MNHLLAMTIPQMPPIDWTGDVCIAVTIVAAALGVLLLWRGSSLSRWLLMFVGAAAGWGVIMMLDVTIGDLPWFITAAIASAAGALAGFLMARVLLALLAGGLVAAAALYWIITNDIANVSDAMPQFNLPANPTPIDWLQEIARVAQQYVTTIWDEKIYVPLGILAAATIVPVIFALLLRRHAVIFITSLFGAAALVFAFAVGSRAADEAVGSRAADEAVDPADILARPISLVAVAAMTLVGTVLQHLLRKKPAGPSSEGGGQ